MAVTRGFALAMAGRGGADDAVLVLPKVMVCGGSCAVVALISTERCLGVKTDCSHRGNRAEADRRQSGFVGSDLRAA